MESSAITQPSNPNKPERPEHPEHPRTSGASASAGWPAKPTQAAAAAGRLILSVTSLVPEWERLFPVYMDWELACLWRRARAVRIDTEKLTQGRFSRTPAHEHSATKTTNSCHNCNQHKVSNLSIYAGLTTRKSVAVCWWAHQDSNLEPRDSRGPGISARRGLSLRPQLAL